MSTKPARIPFWIKLLVVLAVIGGAVLAVQHYLRPVAKVEPVISGDAVDAEPGSVVVKEHYAMQMKSAIAGRVLNKDFKLDTGLHLKEGDILAHLDTSDTEVAIEQIRNTIDSTKQRIALGSSQKFALESANSDFKNTERLFKMGQISDSEYQKARRAVETIQQQLALEKVRDEEDLKTDENDLKAKQLQLQKMTITAPFDGIVSVVNAHPGDLINTGDPLVTMITEDRIVEAKISEENFLGCIEKTRLRRGCAPMDE